MKRKNILILIILSLIPLIFSTTIPYASAKRLNLNILLSPEHIYSSESIIYVSSMQEGDQYTINVLFSDFWDMDLTIKISDTPYILAGQMVDSSSNTAEIMHFVASRTGDHYIQINSKSGSGFFDIRIDDGMTNLATGPLQEFSVSTHILVMILPSIIILLIGIGISLILRNRSKYTLINKSFTSDGLQKEREDGKDILKEEEGHFCLFCGSKIEPLLEICPNCGSSQK